MTDPDEGWDELARELGLEKSEPAGTPDIPFAESAEEPFGEEIELPGVDVDSGGEDSEFEPDDGDESEGEPADGAEAQPGDEQPDPGRKRRRRRRRRKKGPGVEGEAGEAAATEEPGESAAPPIAPRPARAPAPVRPVREETEFVDAEYDSTDAEEPAGMPLAVEEDTAGEVLRELIATWNVPAWDEIVTGLYRPER